MWMLDPDAAFKPPGTVKTGTSAGGDRGVRRTTLCSYESLRFMLMRLVQGINKLGYEYALCSVCVPCRPVPYDEDAAVRLRKPA